ncbi:RHS repeat-associated core domain-containing protein [Plantactinospora sp. B5E13]|uniref:RHS repeat-associated core domain-containing protein n=1 Tax=Plantactinospora sp. B5E13 TaxID=3153758 RepID=UPI00325EDC57
MTHSPFHPYLRRRLVWLATVVVAATLLVAVPAPAAAAGPSVGLPQIPSVPVSAETMAGRPVDPATGDALGGDQSAGGQLAGGGDPTASPLSPSATWSVSTQSGDFEWSYPLRVPPVPGDLVPELALSYRSSTVDGRTSASNNQPSWIGDGWDLNPGFVERAYGACASDREGGTVPPTTGDLCWRSDNATAGYPGGGGQLVRDDTSGQWRERADSGARVERLGGAGNGDDNGEYWKITTVDGTQYFFGSRPAARSTWTVPVFGDDTGEPCHGASFTASRCDQAWRWNLDKVVDPNGNTMLLTYQTETNSYGVNLTNTAVPYVRGGWLERIEYGLHDTAAQTPAARVLFGVTDRCVPGATCALDRPENWPDTPLDRRCVTATCADQWSPTFWTTKRLATVTTQVRRDGGFTDVDRWTLEQQYPRPGDGEDSAALWLRSITHTGLVGGTEALPPVTFEGTPLPNRVYQEDHLSPLLRYRLTGIVAESGGVISVHYAEPDCVPGRSMPTDPHSNTQRCFPVTWSRPGHDDRTDWFHKYVVSTVTLSDRISSSTEQVYAYEYLGGAAWHHDTSEFTPADKRTWNEFRGFAQVRVRQGVPDDPAGPVSRVEQRFHRGMHGDRLPGGGTRSVTVTDSEGVGYPDHDWLQGFEREAVSHLGDSATVVAKTLTEPVWRGPTASRGGLHAYQVLAGTERQITTLEQGRRETRVVTGYDDRGLPTIVDDLGDVGTADDDLCVRTTYLRNASAWLLDTPSRVQTVSVRCAVTAPLPEHAVSDERYSYDGRAWGEAPTTGNRTRVEVLDRYDGTEPRYAPRSTARHDVHGRPVEVGDGLGRTTRTAYTPAVGGPTTGTTVTDPLGFTTTSVLEPALGQPVTVTDVNGNSTDTAYDPLGRVSAVWSPDRPRKWNHPPVHRFSYLVRRDAPTVVTTTRIGPNGNPVSRNELYDGQLRLRQVQVPAVGGGRLITDTRYDSQGRAYKTTSPYFNDRPVDTTLWRASDVEVPGLTETVFDGAGRPVESVFKAGAVVRWRTLTRHGGDRTHVTPPAGGTPTTTVQDGRGRTVELHQYRGATAAGPADVTRYAYTPSGQLAAVTDPAGNLWSYRYDLRGRQVRADHPDKGETRMGYDAADQLTTATDARGQTLAYDYDRLGRLLSLRSGDHEGRLLAEWTYDTVPDGFDGVVKGQPATATSYDADGNPYTRAVLGYTARYQQRQTSVTVPAVEGVLAGTYVSHLRYNPDGSLAGEGHPAVGGLPAEEVFHTYDDAGRPLTTHGGPEGTTVHYVAGSDYTRYGELQRLQLGTGSRRVWLSRYYDPATRRLDRAIIDAELPRPMQSDLHYRYDEIGNLTGIADTPLEQPADRQCFRYDSLRRLTEAWTPAGDCAAEPSTAGLAGPAPYWHSFRYDPTGNRTSRVEHTATGDVSTGYRYPEAGADRPHTVLATTGPEVRTYGYDAAGNTVARGDQRLDWDEQGRLAAVTGDGSTTSFVHDAAGQRLVRREPGAVTLYLGNQEVRLDRSTGAVTATRYYRHGGETVAVRTGAGLTWLAADHHGTAQVAVDSVSLTVTRRRFDPFGNPRGGPPAAWPDDRGFVGGIVDAGTGLTQLGARAYDPGLGRFVSVDPVLDPGDPQQMNGYGYANNNPVSMSDPAGTYHIVDHEGRIRAPAAPGWTEKAKQRVRAQERRWASYYRSQRLRERTQRSCPPDRDCRSPHEKARAAAEAARRRQAAQAFATLMSQLDDLDPTKLLEDPKRIRNLYNLAMKAAGGLELPIDLQSVSFCGQVEGGAGLGVGEEFCVNADSRGVTASVSVGAGLEFGADIDASIALKFNNHPADQVHGEGVTLDLGVDAGGLLHGGARAQWADPGFSKEGATPDSILVKFGVGVGFSVGSLRRSAYAENTGYLGHLCRGYGC